MEEDIHELHSRKVPFRVGDVEVSSKDLLDLGVPNKALSRVYGLVMFELVNESLKNTKEDIINFVKEKILNK
jgi:hypothetical protein